MQKHIEIERKGKLNMMCCRPGVLRGVLVRTKAFPLGGCLRMLAFGYDGVVVLVHANHVGVTRIIM